MQRRSRARGFTLVEILTVLTIISLLASILLPRFWVARDRSAYTACGQNLNNLAVALQSYGNENGQRYPTTLAALAPNYVRSLPRCPEADGADTYSASYEKNDQPATFTMYCRGGWHVGAVGVAPNQPYYRLSEGGLGPSGQ